MPRRRRPKPAPVLTAEERARLAKVAEDFFGLDSLDPIGDAASRQDAAPPARAADDPGAPVPGVAFVPTADQEDSHAS